METVENYINSISLKHSSNGYFAISHGIYYKINDKTYSLLMKVLSGESFDDIAKSFGIEKTDIEKLLTILTQTKKDVKSPKVLHLIYPKLNNFIGIIFSFLFNYKILIFLSLISLISVFMHLYCGEMGIIYSNITIFHYIFIFLFIALWHEFGHVSAAYHKGIKDLNTYLGIFFIFPTFHVQLDQIYTLKPRERLSINYGGIYFQLILSLILFIVYSFFPLDILKLSMNLNIILATYNLLPIMITDGYWIFSDFFQIDNLNKKANKVIKQILKFQLTGNLDFKLTLPILIYSIWKLVAIGALYLYILWFLYRRSFYFNDMYYLMIESQGDIQVIVRSFFLLFPYFLLLLFLYKKIKQYSKTR